MTKRNKIIIITVAAILAVAIIIGLVFLLKGNSSNPTGSTPDDSSSVVSTVEKPSENVSETDNKEEIAKDDSALTIEDIEAERGKEISVPIELKNNPGIAASAIEFKYDTDKLEYIGYTPGEVFENYRFIEKEDSVWFTNIENGDVKKDGIIFYLKFKVKNDAVLGGTEIKIDVNDESFVNFDEEFVNLKGGNAVVTIK